MAVRSMRQDRTRMSRWYKFATAKGSRQKRPSIGKYVLVRTASRGDGMPESICVGYRKNAAGDKQSPYFVVPGLGGDVIEWCDCLPSNFVWRASDSAD